MNPRFARLVLCVLAALPAACAPAPPPAPPPPLPYVEPRPSGFGPERTFTGTLVLGFERQSLDHCWLDFTGTAVADLTRLAPSPALDSQTAPYSAEVTLVGRERHMIVAQGYPPPPVGFGHLSQYPCLIEARQIIAARLLP
ncbi:MAG: hypothetical protein E6G92_05220 [Alphaproteobacteria bacterium]|nr:MAG: hypothetical protein E6G92_05220 [Alphaproteobacteria bacterium]